MSTRVVNQVNEILRPMGGRLHPDKVKSDRDIQACMANIGGGVGVEGLVVPYGEGGFDTTPMGLGEWHSPMYTTLMTSCMAIVGMYATMDAPQRMLLQPIVDGIQTVMSNLSSFSGSDNEDMIEVPEMSIEEEVRMTEDEIDDLVDEQVEIQRKLDAANADYTALDINSVEQVAYREKLRSRLMAKIKEIKRLRDKLMRIDRKRALITEMPANFPGTTKADGPANAGPIFDGKSGMVAINPTTGTMPVVFTDPSMAVSVGGYAF